MSCNCESKTKDPMAGFRESLESINLWAPFERLLNVRETVSTCISAIKKSERASTLGLGADVVNMYGAEAAREDRQVIRQLNTAKAAFQDRVAQPDWPDLTAQLNQLIQEPETQEMISDFKERYVQILLENDIEADKTGQMMSLWDDASYALTNMGPNGLIDWTITRIDMHLNGRSAPEYGRAPNSPLTVAQALCVAAVAAATLAALIACAYIPFCWCCLAGLIAWGAKMGTEACTR